MIGINNGWQSILPRRKIVSGHFDSRTDPRRSIQLRTFAAVAEERHPTRAAQRLHLSQPAVSGQIKALGQEFDPRLSERSSGGMN